MSVLIKGMEMPECCDKCDFAQWSNIHQTAMCTRLYYNPCFEDFSREYLTKRSECCPLVEVKEPHGRLIDADETVRIWEGATIEGSIKPLIDARPTVIEAEGRQHHD